MQYLNRKKKFNALTNPLVNIVLDRPRIAANIASIARLSVGTASALHVCGPLVFESNDKTAWRAGLDYFYGVRIHFHKSIDKCLQLLGKNPWLIETSGEKVVWQADFQTSDVIVFGPEDANIDENTMVKHQARILRLPQLGPVRSYNLAQCVAAVTFEAMRQLETKSVSGDSLHDS